MCLCLVVRVSERNCEGRGKKKTREKDGQIVRKMGGGIKGSDSYQEETEPLKRQCRRYFRDP